MGIELPVELAEVAAAAGVHWPEADEDKMREAAQAWRDAGSRMAELTGTADSTARTALTAIEGDTADAATRHWSAFVQADTGHLTATVAGCAEAADRLERAADQIGAAKVEIVRNLVALAKNTDAANSAAAAGHPSALLGLDAAVCGTAVNIAHIKDTLVSAVQPNGGDVSLVRDVVNANPGAHGPSAGGGAAGPAGSGLLGNLVGGVAETVSGVVHGVADTAQGVATPAGPSGKEPGGLSGAVTGIVGAATGAVHGVADTASGAVQGATGGVLDTAAGVVRGVADTAGGALHGVAGTADGVAAGVGGVAHGVADTASGALHGVADTASGVVDGEVVSDAAHRVGDTALHGRTDSAEGVIHGLADPGGQAHGPAVGLPGSLDGGLTGEALANAPTPPTGIPLDTVQAASAAVLDAPAQAPVSAQPAAPVTGSPLTGPPQAGSPLTGAPVSGGSPLGGGGGSPVGGGPVAAFGPRAAQGGGAIPGQPGAVQAQPGGTVPPGGKSAPAGQPAQAAPTGFPAPGRHTGADPLSSTPFADPDDTVDAEAPTPPGGAPAVGFVGVPGQFLPPGSGGPDAPRAGGPGGSVPGSPGSGGPAANPGAGSSTDPGSVRARDGGFESSGRQVADVGRPSAPPPTAIAPEPPSPRQRGERDDAVILFLVHQFPIGHLPVASHQPARQVPPPPVEWDYAAGLRFEPGDHPRSDLIDRATVVGRVDPAPAREAPELAEGYDPLAGQHERDWDRRFLVRPYDPDDDSPSEYAWPPGELYPEGGTAPGEPEVLTEDTVIDRFGTPEGRVFSADGTAFARRSLPPAHLAAGHHRYRVLRPLPVWRAVSAPWFGQPGGGERYRATQSAADLVALGYLTDITQEADQ
ncbi:TNT domain-containing protein [Actinokineospora iranica]|uniref:DUF4237 domain-containing protein n=1 Tax=Actinokineospora iranica TaxID=1271860 RepID=A0A1G6SWH3_9PSEU|nr:TNT domain-containing protein [Actinokineospora iranica]SDD20596.1 Protein of unknown function [Actinokineospora iranica]